MADLAGIVPDAPPVMTAGSLGIGPQVALGIQRKITSDDL